MVHKGYHDATMGERRMATASFIIARTKWKSNFQPHFLSTGHKFKGAAITTLVLVTVSFVYRNPQAHLFLSL